MTITEFNTDPTKYYCLTKLGNPDTVMVKLGKVFGARIKVGERPTIGWFSAEVYTLSVVQELEKTGKGIKIYTENNEYTLEEA